MSDFAFSRRTPCDQSATVSGSGHRVLASRCFRFSISESAIATVNGRTRADDAGVIAVIALFSPLVAMMAPPQSSAAVVMRHATGDVCRDAGRRSRRAADVIVTFVVNGPHTTRQRSSPHQATFGTSGPPETANRPEI